MEHAELPRRTVMDRYPQIAEHGLIGDLQTAALVTTDGTVDWFCCPRFDSPSVFASLLDHDRGGHFRIAAEGDDRVVKQLYFPDTAILVTRFMTPGGVGEVIDFMPVGDPGRVSDRHRLVRMVRCVRGEMRFVLECAPRFDYGRQAHELELTEQVGGERNWDYRFTWIRDASFSVHALLGLGFTDEAEAFGRWLADRVSDQVGEAAGPLKIMYRVDGSSDLDEELLDHFEGYAGSKPVRIGNGAAGQLQLDIYGEMLDSVWLADRYALRVDHANWTKLSRITDWLCEHWDQPDEGIWETRGGRQNFTYGRLMCWVAVDRMIRLATEHGRPADLDRWTRQRDLIYRQIAEHGWSPDRGAFTQHDKTDVLDASLLMMPLVGFVVPSDSMWLSTLDAMDTELVSDSLVYRYNPSASPDGLRGHEGTFSICTFWYVDALARSGRLEQAWVAFEKMFTYANHLGLYAEEIGLTGEQLGNFPQAFTHLALINAAVNLDYQLDHGAGRDPVQRIGAAT